MEIERHMKITPGDLCPGSRDKIETEIGVHDLREELQDMYYFAEMVTFTRGSVQYIVKDRKGDRRYV